MSIIRPGNLQIPFANSGSKNTIPVASQIGITPGAASYTDGFPPLTMTPLVAGGVPPDGPDVNGVLFAISQHTVFQNSGGQYQFDAALAAAIGGYPVGSVLQSNDGTASYVNAVAGNSVDFNSTPSAIGVSWMPYGGSSMIRPVLTTPTTNVGQLIFVLDKQCLMMWMTVGTFTGYMSPECGMWMDGWTPNPLPFQVNAIGTTVNNADYPALYARYVASGLLVSSGSWVPGTLNICDVTPGTTFKLPDLRNMHKRMTGTNADTANARLLGSAQLDAFASHTHPFNTTTLATGYAGYVTSDNTPGSHTVPFNGGASGGAETRGQNTAVCPYLHV